MKSSAYQLSSRFEGEWKPEYTPYYARKFVRMLSPTQLQDALYTATARPGNFGSQRQKALRCRWSCSILPMRRGRLRR